MKILVRNQTRNTVLANSVEVADTSARRRTGLLRHDRLDQGQGLWIVPCEAVHSFGMKFTIDVVYLDRKKRIRKIRPMLPPHRVTGCLWAHSVLELPAGTVAATASQPGDQLVFEKVSH